MDAPKFEDLRSGDLRKSLVALRDSLSLELQKAELGPRDRAFIVKELRTLLIEINKLPGGEEKSRLDEIAESVPADELAPRRANRKSGAKA